MPLINVHRLPGRPNRPQEDGEACPVCQPFPIAQSWHGAHQSPACEGDLYVFDGAHPGAVDLVLEERTWAGTFRPHDTRLPTVVGVGKALEERLLDDGVSASDWLADAMGAAPRDGDEGEVDCAYVAQACEAASQLPDVTLTPDDLADLRDLSTDFSFDLVMEDEG